MPMLLNFGLLTPLLALLGTVNVLKPLIFAEVTLLPVWPSFDEYFMEKHVHFSREERGLELAR